MQPGVTRRSPASTAVAVALAVTALVGLLATWAASAGPDDVLRGDGPAPRAVRSHAPPRVESDGTPGSRVQHLGVPSDAASIIPWLLLGLVAVLVVVSVVGLILVLLHNLGGLRRGRAHAMPEGPADGEAPDPTGAVVRAMSDDAGEQETLLGEGTPRNGIVQCWHRFEVQATSAGLPARQAETTSEFTLRLLDLVEADASAVARLAGLYREARFSDHEVGEDDREAALQALRLIHGQLRGLLAPGLR